MYAYGADDEYDEDDVADDVDHDDDDNLMM